MSPHPPKGRPQLPCALCNELVELRIKVMDLQLCVTCAAEVITRDGVPKITTSPPPGKLQDDDAG